MLAMKCPFVVRASGCVTTAGASYVVNSCSVSYNVLTYKSFLLK
jgi:hypothetical protein